MVFLYVILLIKEGCLLTKFIFILYLELSRLNQGQIVCNIFGYHNYSVGWWGHISAIWWIEARDAGNDSAMHGTAHHKDLLSPKRQSDQGSQTAVV